MADPQKRLNMVWNGSEWVQILNPTTADLVDVNGTPLNTKLGAIETSLSTHTTDGDIHTTAAEKAKVANLADNANGTYATKTEVTTHADSTTLHKTANDISKLGNLAADANATYATKAELAGQKSTYFATDLADLTTQTSAANGGAGLGASDSGTQALLEDTTGFTTDNTDFEEGRPAMLMWDGTAWQFTYHVGDQTITHNWTDIVGRPTSTVAAIDQAVTDSHTHTNKTVLDNLTYTTELLYNGNPVGVRDSRISMSSTEPTDAANGDLWFAPLDWEPEVTP